MLIAAAALPLLIPPPAKAQELGQFTTTWTGYCGGTEFRHSYVTWILTREELEDTPHWGAPSVVPSRLDAVCWHKTMPRLERPALLSYLRGRFAQPRYAERWDHEQERLMVVVGDDVAVLELERRWAQEAQRVRF